MLTRAVDGRDLGSHRLQPAAVGLVRRDPVVHAQLHDLVARVQERPRVAAVRDRQQPAVLHPCQNFQLNRCAAFPRTNKQTGAEGNVVHEAFMDFKKRQKRL